MSAETQQPEKCWFCEKNSADNLVSIRVQMQGRGGEKKTVTVPRCKVCEEVHTEGMLGLSLGVIIGAVVGLICWYMIGLCSGFWVGLLAWGNTVLLAYLADKSPVSGGIALVGVCAAALGWLTYGLTRSVSPVLGVIAGLFVVGVLAAIGIPYVKERGQMKRARRVSERNGVTTAPEDKKKEYPAIMTLLQQGWRFSEDVEEEEKIEEAPPTKTRAETSHAPARIKYQWQQGTFSPGQLYVKIRPDRCPACGAHLKATTLRALGSIFDVAQLETGVACGICGAWGCTNCCHHHHGGRSAITYTSESVDLDTYVEFRNISWRHDTPCCDCSDEWVGYRQKARWKWGPFRA